MLKTKAIDRMPRKTFSTSSCAVKNEHSAEHIPHKISHNSYFPLQCPGLYGKKPCVPGTFYAAPGTFHDVRETLDDVSGTFHDAPGTLDDVPGTFDDVSGTLDGVPGTLDDASVTLDDVSGTFHDASGTLDDVSWHYLSAPVPARMVRISCSRVTLLLLAERGWTANQPWQGNRSWIAEAKIVKIQKKLKNRR